MNIEKFFDKCIIYELAYPRIRDGLTRCNYGKARLNNVLLKY